MEIMDEQYCVYIILSLGSMDKITILITECPWWDDTCPFHMSTLRPAS